MKEPLHPGEVLFEILKCEGLIKENKEFLCFGPECCAEQSIEVKKEEISKLIFDKNDLSIIMAYKLGRHIKGTDMAFWLKLQEDYDNYRESLDWDRSVDEALKERKATFRMDDKLLAEIKDKYLSGGDWVMGQRSGPENGALKKCESPSIRKNTAFGGYDSWGDHSAPCIDFREDAQE